MSRAIDKAVCQINASDLIEDELRAGKLAQRAKINVRLFKGVMAGDKTGQHPGVGREGILADQRHARVRKRVQPKRFQDREVRVPASHENEFLDGRRRVTHRFMVVARAKSCKWISGKSLEKAGG